MDEFLKKRLLDELKAGRKINAVKILREETNDGLAESLRAVEMLLNEANAERIAELKTDNNLEKAVIEELDKGQHISAVKMVVDTGVPLKEAKNYVDAIQARFPYLGQEQRESSTRFFKSISSYALIFLLLFSFYLIYKYSAIFQ